VNRKIGVVSHEAQTRIDCMRGNSKVRPMSLKYLRQLEQSTFPFTVASPAEVRQIEVLRAALVIKATLERASDAVPAHSATVHEITPVGWLLLKRGAVKI